MVAVRVCACGCGAQVKNKWVRGHHSRVNNVSKRKDIRKRRSERFKQMHADGMLQPWNRGLTKEDPRVAEQSANLDEWRRSEENAKKMSDQWKTGNLVPQRGPAHSQWNGGTSHITQRMRGSRQLYLHWKRPILERDGFACARCYKNSTEARLHVHHDRERFAEIVRKVIDGLYGLERELTFEEGSLAIEAVVAYHQVNQISGITLCEECHEEAHKGLS